MRAARLATGWISIIWRNARNERSAVVCKIQLAASLVRSLFCGLPRQKSRMAVFVSASDESSGKTERDQFFLCGWVAPKDDWSRFFAPAWQERVLDGPPPIPYLHMTEIRSPNWRSQHGLSRDEAECRVDEACDVIDKMGSLFPVGVNVEAGHVLDEFSDTRVVASTGGSRKFEPDYICFLAYALVVLGYVKERHPTAETVDFIVERKEAVTKYIQEFHSTLANALNFAGKPELMPLVGDLIPAGKERVPLQAADALCWHTARYRAGTMDAADERRYAKIGRRKGKQEHLTNEQISQIAAALSRIKNPPSQAGARS